MGGMIGVISYTQLRIVGVCIPLFILVIDSDSFYISIP